MAMMTRIDRTSTIGSSAGEEELRGIVIAMGEGGNVRTGSGSPRLQGFVYGEFLPRTPSLPFGRWKKAS